MYNIKLKRGFSFIHRYRANITIFFICLATFLIFTRVFNSVTNENKKIDKIDTFKLNNFVQELKIDFEGKVNDKDQLQNFKNDELIKKIAQLKTIPNINFINLANNVPNEPKQINHVNNNFNNRPPIFVNQHQQPIKFDINNNNQNREESVKNYESTLKNLERIIHIDLKGAPPKPIYYESFIPMLKKFGATGILLEYEDTFPYEGILAEAKNGHAYTVDDVNMIKALAKQNGLKIIPLVQTYGHLEWLLKLKKFAHLRDAGNYPQVITPCLEESYTVLYEMIDQVIKLHEDVEHFHVGCDEVYYKLVHEKCVDHPFKHDFAAAFMSHLVKIAKYVRNKLPKAKIIFWDDMLQGMDETSLSQFKKEINELEIEPMMWGYMEDVARYFQPSIYEKYGRVFGEIWIATAYKGASGELATLTSIQHHYLNHLSWIEVMQEKMSQNILKFKGVAITGWSRYDHFLALCDILPQSIPSLVFNLQVMQHGMLSSQKKDEITQELGCNGPIPWFGSVDFPIICTFPGHEVYEAMLPLESTLKTLKGDLENAKKYISPINSDYSYLHKKRTVEVMEKLNYNYLAMVTFKDRFISACNKMYWEDTAIEWLTVYFIPQLDELYNLMLKIKNNSAQNDWKPRPLPITLKPYPKQF